MAYFTNKIPVTEPIGLTLCLDGTFLSQVFTLLVTQHRQGEVGKVL